MQWITGLLGLWIVFLAFLGLSGTGLMWALIVTGFAIAALGFLSAGRTEDNIERKRNPHMDSVFQ